jgi:carboxyl-terminal processing protease
VARYYTPKGRSIQRSYQNGKEKYLEEIADRYENGEVNHLDTAKVVNGKFIKPNVVIRFMAEVVLHPNILWVLDTGSLPQKCKQALSKWLIKYFHVHLLYPSHRMK